MYTMNQIASSTAIMSTILFLLCCTSCWSKATPRCDKFDASQEMCCSGKVVPLCAPSAKAACCGTNCYDKTVSTCCNGFINPKCVKDECCWVYGCCKQQSMLR